MRYGLRGSRRALVTCLAAAAIATTLPAVAAATWGGSGAGSAYARSGTWTVVCTSGSVTLTADRDAETQQASPNLNTGGQTTLRVQANSGGARYAFVRFPAPTIPDGCTVTGLTFRMYRNLGSVRTLTIDAVTAPWQEGVSASCTGLPATDPCGITWNNSAALTYGSAAVSWPINSSTLGYWAIDITALGISPDGYRVRDLPTLNAGNSFASRQDLSAPSRKPELVVTWG